MSKKVQFSPWSETECYECGDTFMVTRTRGAEIEEEDILCDYCAVRREGYREGYAARREGYKEGFAAGYEKGYTSALTQAGAALQRVRKGGQSDDRQND